MISESLGPYKIIDELGAGGMGEVYLAEDTRLGRKVALKVLPAEFASDPVRLARFEQEARAAAALNHPHIAAVFDVGSEELEGAETATHFMVQEYLEGDTLREPLKKGALPLEEAVDLATEIAEALAAAHAAGIIHRDLKPENIFITQEGHAKVLDFGLAKLMEVVVTASPGTAAAGEGTRSPTMLGTVAGQIMGTAGYMAPEQVEGSGDIDHRADIFAFGCVFYEMVSGNQPFAGKSVHDTLHRIVDEEPEPLREIAKSLPLKLQWLIEKCLAKNPASRYQHADDLIVDLRAMDVAEAAKGVPDTRAEAVEEASAPVEVSSASRLGPSIPLVVGAPVALLLASAAALGVWFTSRPAPPPLTRFQIDLPPGQARPACCGSQVALSPDGRHLVFSATTDSGAQLFHRRLDELEVTLIPGTEGAFNPSFSPDGQWVVFISGSEIKKVSIAGGEPFRLCDCGANDASWEQGETIYFSDLTVIRKVSANGGEPTEVIPAESGTFTDARELPGGRALLVQERRDINSVGIYSLETNELTILAEDGSSPRYLPTGHIVYLRGSTLFALPFDLETLEALGPAVPVLQGLQSDMTGAGQFGLSAGGTLAYLPGGIGAGAASLVWIDRQGARQPAFPEPQTFSHPDISPDGRLVAVEIASEAGSTDIWVLDLEQQTKRRLTTGGMNLYPFWTPDGTRVVFSSNLGQGATFGFDVFWMAKDGSSPPERLHESPNTIHPFAILPDGQSLLFRENLPDNRDLYWMRLGDDAVRSDLAVSEFEEHSATLSPDGKWVAYVSNVSGINEVFVTPFPGPGGQTVISQGSGTEPQWSADGGELYYRSGAQLIAVQIQTEPELRIGERTVLFEGRYVRASPWHASYDVHPDGRLLMVALSDEVAAARNTIHVVLNWFEELKERVPVGQ